MPKPGAHNVMEILIVVNVFVFLLSFPGPVTLAELDVNAFERLLGSCMSVMRRDVERYKVSVLRRSSYYVQCYYVQ